MRIAVSYFVLAQIVVFSQFAPHAEAQLLISEYVEGSSNNNKALEIWNPSNGPIPFTGLQLEVYFDGSATAGSTVILSPGFVLPAGEVFVIAQSSATFAASADQISPDLDWNGDDAVIVRAGIGGAVVDSLGQVGFDPGTEWGSGFTSTANNTLRREPSNLGADTNPMDSYEPANQFSGFPTDDFSHLGIAPVPEPVAGCLIFGGAVILLRPRKKRDKRL